MYWPSSTCYASSSSSSIMVLIMKLMGRRRLSEGVQLSLLILKALNRVDKSFRIRAIKVIRSGFNLPSKKTSGWVIRSFVVLLICIDNMVFCSSEWRWRRWDNMIWALGCVMGGGYGNVKEEVVIFVIAKRIHYN